MSIGPTAFIAVIIAAALAHALIASAYHRGLARGRAEGWLEHYDETVRKDQQRKAALNARRDDDGQFGTKDGKR